MLSARRFASHDGQGSVWAQSWPAEPKVSSELRVRNHSQNLPTGVGEQAAGEPTPWSAKMALPCLKLKITNRSHFPLWAVYCTFAFPACRSKNAAGLSCVAIWPNQHRNADTQDNPMWLVAQSQGLHVEPCPPHAPLQNALLMCISKQICVCTKGRRL